MHRIFLHIPREQAGAKRKGKPMGLWAMWFDEPHSEAMFVSREEAKASLRPTAVIKCGRRQVIVSARTIQA
jgi:hypothetical protein